VEHFPAGIIDAVLRGSDNFVMYLHLERLRSL